VAPGTYPADRPTRWPRSDSDGNARSKHRNGVPRTPGQYRPPPLTTVGRRAARGRLAVHSDRNARHARAHALRLPRPLHPDVAWRRRADGVVCGPSGARRRPAPVSGFTRRWENFGLKPTTPTPRCPFSMVTSPPTRWSSKCSAVLATTTGGARCGYIVRRLGQATGALSRPRRRRPGRVSRLNPVPLTTVSAPPQLAVWPASLSTTASEDADPGQCSSIKPGSLARRTSRKLTPTSIASSSCPATGTKSGTRSIGEAR
jgi:hypothetical protein